MSWANVGFIVVLGMALVLWVAFDPAGRAQFAQRWAARVKERRQRRDRGVLEAQTRQADLDAIHRHYRTSVRYYQAGHDPVELAPVWLPSKGPQPGTRKR